MANEVETNRKQEKMVDALAKVRCAESVGEIVSHSQRCGHRRSLRRRFAKNPNRFRAPDRRRR